MPGKISVLLAVFLLCSIYHSGNNGSPVYELYKKADKLFNLENPTDHTDSVALATFRQVIQLLEKEQADSLLFQSWWKTGVLLDVKTSYHDAKQAYLQAIEVRMKGNAAPDSLLFLTYVYAGTAYYHLNNFDSADYFLLQAEAIGNQFPRVPEKDRLYNALGALYYENGNYMQSRNYFSRALEIIRENNPADKESAIHFEGNIAASNYRLGLYEQSLKQYENLLSLKLYTSQISINMGKAYVLTKNYAAALKCFRRVDVKQLPGVMNEIAHVHQLASNVDSALFYLDKFKDGYDRGMPHFTRLDLGINHLYRSDIMYDGKMELIQKAIIIFSGNFTNEDIAANPSEFAGSFASYKLFEALFRKAGALERVYMLENKSDHLLLAYNAYKSAIELLRYIEKSYDTDDAKLFLKQKSQSAYTHAFLLCMLLADANPGKDYLEQAFLITEKNKASIIAARLMESRQKKMRGIDPALLQQERNIKYNIARLIIKSEAGQDKTLLDSLAKERQHLEIELSRLQKKIEQNSSYYKLKYADSFPSISDLQKNIGKKQAVVSLYADRHDLHMFVITDSGLKHVKIDSLRQLREMTDSWVGKLRTSEVGRRFDGGETGSELSRQLVNPILALAPGKDEWILMPDDIFHYLPFESLPAGDGFLLETAAISYHFSTRFLIPATTKAQKKYDILSMAPFAARGFEPMERLPRSAEEIAGLRGQQFSDSQATKEHFLESLNQYPVMHLATHAIADISNSSRSYIAFYPGKGLAAENNLYLDELYGLNMDSTELVIISACETGAGQLIGSEGVISLSRGFTYAGCNSVLNSLWKADDAATAAILKQFHVYLKKGYAKSKALQKAKMDYLRSNTVNKSPDYWAHLILIGDIKPLAKKRSSAFWIAIFGPAAVMSMTAIYVGNKKRKKKTTS